MLRTTVITAFAFGVVVIPASLSWTGPLDARPEAIVTGSALLALAAILRQFRLQTGSK